MSPLESRAREYLALRRSLGHKLEEHGRRLPSLVAFLEQNGNTTVTVEAALAWAQQHDRPPGSSVPPSRMRIARGFARFMSGIDPATEVPPPGLLPARRSRRIPYLYTPADIQALMLAADEIPTPLRSATYRTLIGLLAATGMRVGEAIRLSRADIDWDDGLLVIRETKFGKSRELVLHDTTIDALAEYARVRDQRFPQPRCDAFLVSLRGTRLRKNCIQHMFARLLRVAGVRPRSPRCRPRVHDLRHAYAVRTLLEWYRDGVDVQARLPLLSTYLGHVNPASTFYYLHAAPELLGLIAQRLDATIEDLA